ncbi:MAG TPA: hypothetical protein VF228_17325 [Iamia sp.]
MYDTPPHGVPTAAPAPMSRRRLAVIVTASAVGLGLCVAAVAYGSDDIEAADVDPVPARVTAPSNAERFEEAAEAFELAAPTSTDTCCESLSLTIGERGYPTPEEAEALAALLESLDFPASTLDRMGQTRALDGTQTAESELATAWWTYHPDDGMTVILEPARD